MDPSVTEELTERLPPGDQLILIDFWAPWCAPCRKLGAELEAIRQANPKLHIIKVNVDDESDMADALGIQKLPTVQIWRDKIHLDTVTGLDVPALKATIAKHSL